MADIKYMLIKSFEEDEVVALFDGICKNIAKKNSRTVKREFLKLEGSDKEMDRYKPTMHDVIRMVIIFDIPIELKLKYVANAENAGPVAYSQEQKFLNKAVDKKTVLEEQASDIKNHSLKEVAKVNTMEEVKLSSESIVDPNKIPDAPDFIQ